MVAVYFDKTIDIDAIVDKLEKLKIHVPDEDIYKNKETKEFSLIKICKTYKIAGGVTGANSIVVQKL